MEGVCDLDMATGSSTADERDQLARLFDDQFDAIYRFCLARTGDRSAADDAASEAFLAAARVFASGRGEEVDRPWLFVVARNRIVDQWRAGERHRQRLRRVAQQPQEIADDGQAIFGSSAVADRVIDVLSSLPERQRAALTLRYLDECSVAEVADHLEVSYQTAESLLARARRSFAAAWEHHDG